jgi:catechol 2,3-dioxygenase-like lactoylglutathione lyase family enzyme
MAIRGVTPILNVSSVPASFAFFESLGWRRGFAWNDGGMIEGAADSNAHGPAAFGSVCGEGEGGGEAQIFLCTEGQGGRGTIEPRWPGDDRTDGVWMSWWLDSPASVDAMHDACLRHGHRVTMPPTDEPWGVRELHLRHPDGHMFRVSAALAPARDADGSSR